MSPKKDEYMRGYHDGYKEASAEMLAALKAAEALAFCGMATDCYSRQEIEALCRGTIETFRAAIAKAAQP